jgi:hypothetical protein
LQPVVKSLFAGDEIIDRSPQRPLRTRRMPFR